MAAHTRWTISSKMICNLWWVSCSDFENWKLLKKLRKIFKFQIDFLDNYHSNFEKISSGTDLVTFNCAWDVILEMTQMCCENFTEVTLDWKMYYHIEWLLFIHWAQMFYWYWSEMSFQILKELQDFLRTDSSYRVLTFPINISLKREETRTYTLCTAVFMVAKLNSKRAS